MRELVRINAATRSDWLLIKLKYKNWVFTIPWKILKCTMLVYIICWENSGNKPDLRYVGIDETIHFACVNAVH